MLLKKRAWADTTGDCFAQHRESCRKLQFVVVRPDPFLGLSAQGVLDNDSAINVLEVATKKLQAMTLERDGLACQLAITKSDRDSLACQLAMANTERDGLASRLAMATSEESRLSTHLNAALTKNIEDAQAAYKHIVDLGRTQTLLRAVRHDEARATAALQAAKSQVTASVMC